MRTILGLTILIAVAAFVFAIHLYITSWGVLEGDIVFSLSDDENVAVGDSMYVFLISAEIEPMLDSLNAYYKRDFFPLESTVENLRDSVQYYTHVAQEEEAIFRMTVASLDPGSRVYRQNKKIVDDTATARDSVVALFQEKRRELIKQQRGFNSVIATLIESKAEHKALVDENGHFVFPKIPVRDYFIYALKIVSGNKDITRLPADMYYLYAFSAEPIRKYSWMTKISVAKRTYIRLDRTNMSQVFK